MDASVSTLTALAVFESTVEHGRDRLPDCVFLVVSLRVADGLALSLLFSRCLYRRREERPRAQGGREESRGGVGPVGEVGRAGVRPLRRRQHRGRRAPVRAADTAGGVPRPAGVPRGADGGRVALHCGVRLCNRREAVLPAAAHAMPHLVRTIRSHRIENGCCADALIIQSVCLFSFQTVSVLRR